MARKRVPTGQPAGRPGYRPTQAQRDRVQQLSARGAPLLDIAKDLGISNNTLVKHFEDDLRRGEFLANTNVAGVMYSMAVDKKHKKCFDAAKYWLERRAGWAQPGKGGSTPAQGKKEQQAEAAKNAGAGTEWGDLLQTPPIKQLQ